MDAQKIKERIKDSSYFKDAREWYFEKYVFPVTERTIAFIFAAFCVVMLLIVAFNIRTLTSVPQRIPLVIYVQNSITEFLRLRALGTREDIPQSVVARYLIEDYVRTREEFIPARMTLQHYPYIVKKIKSSSSKNVLNEFKGYMSNTNPYSPFIRYNDSTERRISIVDFSFLTDDLMTGKAVVKFDATEYHPDGKETHTPWEAIIHYRLPDIEIIAQTQAPLRFLVKYYRAKLIKN